MKKLLTLLASLTALSIMSTLITPLAFASDPVVPSSKLDVRSRLLGIAAQRESQAKKSEPSLQKPWLLDMFTPTDAPVLRELLTDATPAVRALAAEWLAGLDQVEDIPRIANLLGDTAQGVMVLEPSRLHIALINGGKPSSPQWVWRRLTVSQTAQAALHSLTGKTEIPDATPQRWRLNSETGQAELSVATPQGFQTWWSLNSDIKNSLWYWRKEFGKHPNNVDWFQNVRTKLGQQSPETEAKVLLLSPLSSPQSTVSQYVLRITPERQLQLLEGINLWPDVDWKRYNNKHTLLENLTRSGSAILQPQYATRIAAALAKLDPRDGESHLRSLLTLALARSQATPAQRDAVLRSAAQTDTDELVRSSALAELVAIGMPGAAGFIKERFFIETSGRSYSDSKHTILMALGHAPLTLDKRQLLCDLVLDARFTPFLTNNQNSMGSNMWRKYALSSLNAHAGKELIPLSSPQERALHDPATSAHAVTALHKQVRTLRDAKP